MPYCICLLSNGNIKAATRWGPSPSHDPSTEIVVQVDHMPDPNLEIWDGATGLRSRTAAELDAINDEFADRAITDAKFAVVADALWDIYQNAGVVSQSAVVNNAVSAGDRVAFNQFLKDRFKAKL